MLTLLEVARRTDKLRQARAKYVKILKMKKGYNQIGQAYIAAQTQSTHDWDPRKRKFVPATDKNVYLTKFVFFDSRLHVLCSCSCDDFKYREEYALTTHDASIIEYSNGDPAVIRNPTNRAYLCKHEYRLFKQIEPLLRAAGPHRR